MSSGMFVIEDPFGMGFTESSTARRWREKPDLDIFGKKLDGTLCGQRQFICSVTSLHLSHLGHQLVNLLWELKMTIVLASKHMSVDKCI